MYLAAPLPLLFLFLVYLDACTPPLAMPMIFVFLCDLLNFTARGTRDQREQAAFTANYHAYHADLTA
ncbi:hypothetical protein JTF19_16590 [Enterobacteriaceae bacterium RIT814]|nr:hypothetical protein [Enterobacteriaceae bacterium RIT 814]